MSEALTKTTHRQYLAWNAWFDGQWNKPSRTDHYIMQAAAAAGGAKKVNFKELKIPFVEERAPAKITVEQETAWAQSAWFRAVGYNGNAS